MNCTTITENVASGAVEDGTMSINERMTVTCSDLDEFPSEEICKSPLIVDCMNLPHLGMYKDYYTVMGSSHKNGAFRNISCAADAAPTDGKYPIDTWGEEWYEGPRLSNSSCNNGTWMYIKPVNMAVQKPEHLTCFTKEQIRLLKMMIHYYKSTMASLNATKKIPFKWIDSSAVERMDKLVHAQTNAKRMWDDALNGEMASVDDFKTVIAALIENAMIHRGEEFNQTTCDDFQNHMLYQLKHAGPQRFANYVPPQNASLEFPGYPTHEDVDLEPVLPFKCSWAVQKSSIGWDFMNARPVMYYRNGCSCTVKWLGGCPFQIQMSPSYKFFGFDSMTEKQISPAMGAKINSLCWYWSTPTHPEWGYIWGVPYGTSFQAPAKNGTQLQHEWNDLRKKIEKDRKKKEKKDKEKKGKGKGKR